MSLTKIAATILIFLVASAGWFILGSTTAHRSTNSSTRLGPEVEALWGQPLRQHSPQFTALGADGSAAPQMPTKSDIKVELSTDYRHKGLVWYPTYRSAFSGTYVIENNCISPQTYNIQFSFPTPGGTYDSFAAAINDERLQSPVNIAQGLQETLELQPGETARFSVAYETRGMREWRYALDPSVGRVQNMSLEVLTNFEEVDYPEGCLSPMSMEETDAGQRLVWQASDLITTENIGVVIPEKLNPGPLASRITFFAPVCLLFFFILVATINILYKVDIHPMHYLFVAAGFFAFHLLLAYLVDVINIHLAFLISAVVSVFLVTSYLSAALRGRFPWRTAIGGQLFFLVLFSYSFFLEGLTGLTVAIGSVVTLAFLMRVTAQVDWNDVFTTSSATPPTPPAVKSAAV